MNRQILSFTYNFDTSHLNNNNNGNSENSSNDNSGKNEINTTVPSSPSLSNSNYFSYLQNNNNYTNNTSTTPLITSSNLQSNNNMSLSNSYSHLNLGQSQYLPPIQTSSNYMSSPMPFNNQMSGGYLNAPLNVTNTLPPLKNLNPLSQSRPKINPLNYVPSTPNTPLFSSLSTSTSLYNNPLNGFGHEHLDLGGEENEELKKMNGQLGLSQFSQYIPTQENVQESSQDNHKETNDEDFNSDQKEPVLQNVISTFNLDCKLDLPKIQKKARNTEYHPKRFAALVMRIKSPQTTALIFSSGKVVVTGAKNESESKLACKKFARIVKKLDFPATFKDFKIQNIVASCEVGHKVSLETLKSSEHSSSCNFEPELFPGLIYKMIEPKVTLLIFVSGKIVITGAKNKKGVEAAFKNISPVLSNFKKPS